MSGPVQRFITSFAALQALLQLPWSRADVERASVVSLIQSDGAAIAVAPLVRKRIGGAEVVAAKIHARETRDMMDAHTGAYLPLG